MGNSESSIVPTDQSPTISVEQIDDTLEFVITKYGIKTMISIDEPVLCDIGRWTTFAKNLEEHKEDSLVFCDSNGECKIFCDAVNIAFVVSKYGAGGGGRIIVDLDINQYGGEVHSLLMGLLSDVKFVKMIQRLDDENQ